MYIEFVRFMVNSHSFADGSYDRLALNRFNLTVAEFNDYSASSFANLVIDTLLHGSIFEVAFAEH